VIDGIISVGQNQFFNKFALYSIAQHSYFTSIDDKNSIFINVKLGRINKLTGTVAFLSKCHFYLIVISYAINYIWSGSGYKVELIFIKLHIPYHIKISLIDLAHLVQHL